MQRAKAPALRAGRKRAISAIAANETPIVVDTDARQKQVREDPPPPKRRCLGETSSRAQPSNALNERQVATRSRAKKACADLDQAFLDKATEEFSKVKPKANSQRLKVVRLIQRYLPEFALPDPQRYRGKRPDAHFFDDTIAARHFMTNESVIQAPVFVKEGANYSLIDRESNRRPIDQMFEFLPLSSERQVSDDESKPYGIQMLKTTIGGIRERFQQHNGFVQYPWNFPDIGNPMPDHARPGFLAIANATVLGEMVRSQLDVVPQDVCNCPGNKRSDIPGCTHFTTQNDFFDTYHSWCHWQGTAMIAEAGAVTYPHWDRFALPTWLACLEGEIGFGWLSYPTEEEHMAWRMETSITNKPHGRWLFKVLRPGDALYMPSGLVHFVFRRPQGTQTLGFAGHLVRRQDLIPWITNLNKEVQSAIQDKEDDNEYSTVVPSIIDGLRRLLNEAKVRGQESKYRGEKNIREVLRSLNELEKKLEELEPKSS